MMWSLSSTAGVPGSSPASLSEIVPYRTERGGHLVHYYTVKYLYSGTLHLEAKNKHFENEKFVKLSMQPMKFLLLSLSAK